MNEARRENNRIKTKERWIKAEEYGKILNMSKHDIFNHYFDICDKYKDYLLDPNKEQLFFNACVREILQKKEFLNSKNEAVGIKRPSIGTARIYKEEVEQQPIDYLKLMLWAINKIGSIEKAEKIFNAAKLAMEAIKE